MPAHYCRSPFNWAYGFIYPADSADFDTLNMLVDVLMSEVNSLVHGLMARVCIDVVANGLCNEREEGSGLDSCRFVAFNCRQILWRFCGVRV